MPVIAVESARRASGLSARQTTGQAFTIRLKNGKAWNCTAAGLVANPGDKIIMRLVGKR